MLSQQTEYLLRYLITHFRISRCAVHVKCIVVVVVVVVNPSLPLSSRVSFFLLYFPFSVCCSHLATRYGCVYGAATCEVIRNRYGVQVSSIFPPLHNDNQEHHCSGIHLPRPHTFPFKVYARSQKEFSPPRVPLVS